VASLLAKSGWSVIGVEPDERMAGLARARGVHVVVAPFERCVLPGGEYDLVCSGTAWHWIDPAVGYDIAAALLRRGGRLAVFRNIYVYEANVAKVIQAVLQRHAPSLLDDCVPLGIARPALVESHARELTERSDLFTDLDRQTFEHERQVTADDWIRELETHSPVAALDHGTRARLLRSLARRVTASTGGPLRIRHETPCVVATRR
jgi:SAM-dependent methyltransferase